jgi:hypothetical protein
MLKHSGVSARELFPDLLVNALPQPGLPFERAAGIELVRRRRDEYEQDISFGARPFILCGLPIRRLPSSALKYSRRNGRFCLDIIGHPDYGVPFGQDRLVLLWLATQAVRNRTPVVRFGSAAEILIEWGMPTNGSHYNRLQQAFLRVFGSTIFFGTKDEHAGAEVWDTSRRHFLDHMRLWFRNERLTESTRRENIVTLSPAFWDELIAHPIPVDTEVIRALANNPGCLDLYTWLTWRCHQAKDAQRIPLFGPMGLANQLGVQEYARERKFRERVRLWLELVRLYWPACPARIAKNGAFLELNNATAIHAQRSA